MSTADTKKSVASEKELVLVREFDAPRDLVWKVWNEPEHIEKWFGPRGFDTRVPTFEFRVNGKFEYVMVGPDGTEYPSKGIFKEIIPGQKVVITDEFGEGFENIESLKGVDLPKGQIVTTAEFEDMGGRCRLTLTISHATVEDRKRHEDMGVFAGWNSSFEKMDEYLAALT